MPDVEKRTTQDAAVRETATRLRVGVGAFKRRTQEALSEGELTLPQLTALSRLDRFGPSTTAELARREQITPQAMGPRSRASNSVNWSCGGRIPWTVAVRS